MIKEHDSLEITCQLLEKALNREKLEKIQNKIAKVEEDQDVIYEETSEGSIETCESNETEREEN